MYVQYIDAGADCVYMVQDWATAKATKSKFWGRSVTSILYKNSCHNFSCFASWQKNHIWEPWFNSAQLFGGQIASKSFSMFFELFDFMACRNLFNELSFSASKSCQLNLVTSADVAGHPWDWLRKAQVLEVESNMRASFQFLPCPKTYNPKAYPRICSLCTIIYQNMIPVLSSTCHVWRDCFLRK